MPYFSVDPRQTLTYLNTEGCGKQKKRGEFLVTQMAHAAKHDSSSHQFSKNYSTMWNLYSRYKIAVAYNGQCSLF